MPPRTPETGRRLIFFEVLYRVSNLVDRWHLLHRLGQWISRSLIFPTLERKLLSDPSQFVVKVELRGSTVASSYHIFMSDLDITVVLKNLQALPQVQSSLKKLKKLIPFLGEAEIYTSQEKQTLDRLFVARGELYQRLRDFRKVAWMEVVEAKAPTKFHRRKAQRAVQNILKKYQAQPRVAQNQFALRSMLEATLTTMGSIEISSHSIEALRGLKFYSDYYGAWIGVGPAVEFGPAIPLVPELAILALAVAPGYWDHREEIQRHLDEVRKSQIVRQIWYELSSLEYLIFESAMRNFEPQEPWVEEWRKALQESVRQSSMVIESRFEVGQPDLA